MNKTGYIYHPLYLEHDTGQHPENFGRLVAIDKYLKGSEINSQLQRHQPRPATLDEIALNHVVGYAESVQQSCAAGERHLDADTAICSKSFEAALLSTGAGLKAVDLVVDGTCDNVFCAVRPPGHHAEHDRSMGFCLFNNVAIAADYAIEKKGLDRVFIFDWDVHHGNGTQHSFYSKSNVYYSSVHQYPFYPGTGAAEETGTGDGLGTTLNFPLRAFSRDEDYLALVKDKLIPEMFRFKPDLILLSAGFDAHEDDPLAQMEVSTECYGAMTEMIVAAAGEICEGRLISMLEGGYDPDALAGSVHAHLKHLIS